jgi:hypothetical protein
MPTPSRAFAAVAHALADVDPREREAVATFYHRTFINYPMAVRSLVSDFLVGQTSQPSALDLKAFKNAVALRLQELPSVEAPAWAGQPMEYLPDAGKKVAAAG